MKKILILLISLSILIPFNISAKEEKVLTIDLSKYTSVYEMKLIEYAHFTMLIDQHVLNTITENNIKYITDNNGKRLMKITYINTPFRKEYTTYQILEGIGKNDTQEYTLTNQQKEELLNKNISEKNIYDKVILKFGPQDFSKEDYVIEMKHGTNFMEDYGILLLRSLEEFLQNDIKSRSVIEIRNTSGKLLCVLEEEINANPSSQKVEIAPNVTKDDDIIYNLTPAEQQKAGLESDKIIYNFSGSDYSNETNAYVIDMHDTNEINQALDMYMIVPGISNQMKCDMKIVFESLNGKKLAYLPLDITKAAQGQAYPEMINNNITVYDGVGEEDTIYYNIPDSSEIRTLLP